MELIKHFLLSGGEVYFVKAASAATRSKEQALPKPAPLPKPKSSAINGNFGYMEQYGQFHPWFRLFGTRLHGISAYLGHFSRDKRVPYNRKCLYIYFRVPTTYALTPGLPLLADPPRNFAKSQEKYNVESCFFNIDSLWLFPIDVTALFDITASTFQVV